MLQSVPRQLAVAILVLSVASLYPMIRAPAQAGRPSFPSRPVVLPILPPSSFPGGNNPNITISGFQTQNNGSQNQPGGFQNQPGGFQNMSPSGFQNQIGIGSVSGSGFGFQPIVIPGAFGGASSINQMPQIRPQPGVIGQIMGFQGVGGSLQGFGGFQAGGFQAGGQFGQQFTNQFGQFAMFGQFATGGIPSGANFGKTGFAGACGL